MRDKAPPRHPTVGKGRPGSLDDFDLASLTLRLGPTMNRSGYLFSKRPAEGGPDDRSAPHPTRQDPRASLRINRARSPGIPDSACLLPLQQPGPVPGPLRLPPVPRLRAPRPRVLRLNGPPSGRHAASLGRPPPRPPGLTNELGLAGAPPPLRRPVPDPPSFHLLAPDPFPSHRGPDEQTHGRRQMLLALRFEILSGPQRPRYLESDQGGERVAEEPEDLPYKRIAGLDRHSGTKRSWDIGKDRNGSARPDPTASDLTKFREVIILLPASRRRLDNE